MPTYKLTDEQELEVFDAWAVDGVPMAALARRYNVTHDVVQRIVYRMTRPDHPRIRGKRPVLGPLLTNKPNDEP